MTPLLRQQNVNKTKDITENATVKTPKGNRRKIREHGKPRTNKNKHHTNTNT